MGFYDRHVLPRLINLGCGLKPVRMQREKVVPGAHGRVLEIGAGTGLNLPFYDATRVEHLWALDPSPESWTLAGKRRSALGFKAEFVEGSAEDIPLKSASADSVVVTYALCTIPDAAGALAEIRRVLKPDGELIFCEHGLAPDDSVRRWQNRVNPLWSRMFGGCNLNRDIPALLREAGFEISQLDTMYLPGWKPAGFNYWGQASAS